jgi:ABC-type sugar transport system ATPase subunit
MVLDEPTSGLHSTDVAGLLDLVDDLVDHGTTLIVIEHNLQVAARADHIIDVGPGAGNEARRVGFSGTPSGVATSGTITGNYLSQAPDSMARHHSSDHRRSGDEVAEQRKTGGLTLFRVCDLRSLQFMNCRLWR